MVLAGRAEVSMRFSSFAILSSGTVFAFINLLTYSREESVFLAWHLEIVWTKSRPAAMFLVILAQHEDLCVALVELIRLANDLSVVRHESGKIMRSMLVVHVWE
jgi:hypothetical protein